MKKIIINLLLKFYSFFPWSAKEAIHSAYIKSKWAGKIELSVLVSGKFGLVIGSFKDTSILKGYYDEGVWAQRTNELLSSFFESHGYRGTYLDIGANIGLTTIPHCNYKEIKCHCFEPDPLNFDYLTFNILKNSNFKNVELHNCALSDKQGKLQMELSPDNLGDHRLKFDNRISKADENSRAIIEVDANRLDSFDISIKNPLAIKIDTQGAEPLVISGGLGVISRANLVILEYSPYMMNRMGVNPENIWNLVAQFSRIRILESEASDEKLTQELDINQAVEKLKILYEESKEIPFGAYWDIILEK